MSQEEAHQDAVNDFQAEQQEQQEEIPGMALHIPNGDDDAKVEYYNDEQDWANRYHELLLAMYRSTHSSLTPQVKRTKMKDLKEANKNVLENFNDKQLAEELETKRLEWNKSLSIMARENPD